MSTACLPQMPCKTLRRSCFSISSPAKFPLHKFSDAQNNLWFPEHNGIVELFRKWNLMEQFYSLLQVGNEPTVYHQTQDNLLWSSKDLKIQVGIASTSCDGILNNAFFRRFFLRTISTGSWYFAAQLKWELTMLISRKHHLRRHARNPSRKEVKRIFLFARN